MSNLRALGSGRPSVMGSSSRTRLITHGAPLAAVSEVAESHGRKFAGSAIIYEAESCI